MPISDETLSGEQRLLQARAARYARATEDDGDFIDVIAGRRGRTQFAIPLANLRGIRRLAPFCAIPGTSPIVPGAVYHRGEILSVHDLQALLAEPVADVAPWMAVLDDGAGRFAVMADEVVGQRRVAVATIQPIPVTMGEFSRCFRGLISREWLLLDVPALRDCRPFFVAR